MADYKYAKPAKKLSKDEESAVVERVREGIEDCSVFERDNRREAEIDLQFVAGDQWPAAVKAARGTTRPMLTINQLPQFVQLVTNPTRVADIGIKAVPVDSQSDPETAKIYDELFKAIQYQSNAKQVYVQGNEHQAKCGIGWWRICTQYVDDEVFDQEIRIKRINNPLSVYCDPAAVEPDRSDAMWMAVVEQWPRKTFKKKYPKASINSVDVPSNIGRSGSNFEWATPDNVIVAEWYEKVPKTKTLALLGDGSTIDITDKGEGELGALDAQMGIQGTREIECYEVKKYLVNGLEVLEGPIDWAGKYIPLIPVLGAETPYRDGTMRYGIVRFARDPQQLLNFAVTSKAETIGLAPKAPYVTTMSKIKNYLQYWNTANTENRPFLPYDADPGDPGPPKRERPADVPEAMDREAERSQQYMQVTTGIYPSALGNRSNETSGVAIGARQQQTDTANGHYADNLMTALGYTGRVIMDLIPKIYDNERVLRWKDEKGKEQAVTINKVLYTFDDHYVVTNDLSVGKYDVRVTVGKNYLTQRLETLNALLEMTKGLPPQAQMLMLDLIVKNMDFPDAEELVRRFRSLVPPAALADPNDPNAPKPPGPEDDPELVAKIEKMAAEIEDLKAAAKLKEAQRVKTLAEADATDAETGTVILPQIVSANSAHGAQEPIPKPPAGFQGGELGVSPEA